MSDALRYGHDDQPGIRRLGRSRFRYVGPDGGRVAAADLERIEALVIPPAWTDVWIAPAADWHLQATGRDAKGRKQYRYHDDFRAEREAAKFEDLRSFGLGLSALRRVVARELEGERLTHDRVCAAVVRLLDTTLLRVGNEAYARDNGSYGLTTLRTKHVDVTRSGVRLHFTGKHAHEFDVTVGDARVGGIVRKLQHLPGQLLFQYVNGDGEPHSIGSAEVNRFLQEHACATATAKTFRTWGASVMTASLLAVEPRPTAVRLQARVVNDAVRVVADRLGNTLAVCKRSYVHPVVLESFADGSLAERWQGAAPSRPGGLSADERRFWVALDDAAS